MNEKLKYTASFKTRVMLILEEINRKLDSIIAKEKTIMSDLTTLTAAVEKTTEVEQSAVTLLNGLAQQIADLKNDPAALQALSDQLNAQADTLAAAITANTPTA